MRGKLSISPAKGVEWSAPPVTEAGAEVAPASYTPMVYQGGPILTAPELVSFYWGAFTPSEISEMQAWLEGFSGYLNGAEQPRGQENVVQQYGVFGASVGPCYQVPTAPSSATEANVQTQITTAQATGHLPAFGPERLFLVFTKGVSFNGYNTAWCGYHGSWGQGKYFAICPQLTGLCATGGALQAWQGVTAHEILEACSDPAVGRGWTEGSEEGGDSCNRNFAPMSFGTTQRFADNLNQACSVWTLRETPQISAACWAHDRIDTFVRGTDLALYHRWWDGSQWGGFETLGGEILGCPKVVSWGPNRLDVFARGLDGALYHRWWDGTSWGGWESLGGVIIGDPVPVSWAADRLDIFAVGLDGALWHRWWDGFQWGGWESLGGTLVGPPSAVAWGPNRLDVFARGNDGAMYHRWWDGSSWGGWEDLGGVILCSPQAVSWAADRIDVFARGTDGAMYHRWWDGSSWGGWEDLGGVIVGAPMPVAWGPNRLDVFARGTDGAMYHRWWDGSSWGGWENLNGVIIGAPVPVSWQPDRLDIFAEGTDNALYHRWWDGSSWGGWESLGGVIQ
jgi:hypothetical protein